MSGKMTSGKKRNLEMKKRVSETPTVEICGAAQLHGQRDSSFSATNGYIESAKCEETNTE